MSPGKLIRLIIIGSLPANVVAAETNSATPDFGLVPLPVSRPPECSEQMRGTCPGVHAPVTQVNERTSRGFYRELLEREARLNGLPPDIADAVTAVESGYDPSAVGAFGEIGLMQVRPPTAAMLGFIGGPAELAKPEVNIHYGVTYLAQAWRLSNGDLCRALMKYRAGHGEETMTALSIQYCDRARAHLAAIGSIYAGGASVPLMDDRVPMRTRARSHGPRVRTPAISAAFWAAHEARVRAITRRIEAKWRKLAAK